LVDVGPETKIACDKALELAATDPKNSMIVATAGKCPQQKWQFAWMSQVMKSYMRREDKSACVMIGRAETFNTSGEMKCLAGLLSSFLPGEFGVSESEVIIVVKWWHAPRAKFLCRYWLKRNGFGQIPVSMERCPSNVGRKTIILEFLGAWPKNLLRIIFCR
jgi:hypothetical protein